MMSLRILFAVFLGSCQTVLSLDIDTCQNSARSISGFSGCDALLAAGLEDLVVFPDNELYKASISSYYSIAVQQLRPWCIIQPKTNEEVSRALVALVESSAAGNWDIAIRGGGHSHFASNNVANGVTIDLSLMNGTSYNETSELASIGPGARWASVFEEFEPFGRSVTGGRLGSVGVAGLILGGGASFYTGTRGFACDDVQNFEVVLADGSITNANAEEIPDLFKALKGGSSNFGIVTRFDMRTFPAARGGLYGGIVRYDLRHKNAILNQFVRLVDINDEHPADSEAVAFLTSGDGPTTIIVYAVNTIGVENSTSFAPLTTLPSISDGRARRSYGELISVADGSAGERTVWFSISFKNSINMLNRLMELHQPFLEEPWEAIPKADLAVQFVLQPLAKHFGEKGNNVLGITSSVPHNSIIFLAQVDIKTVEQESYARVRLASFIARLEHEAEQLDASTYWRFLNYANPAQNPLGSYGEENVRFLKEVARKYDPDGVFQTRVPGGFKISRVS